MQRPPKKSSLKSPLTVVIDPGHVGPAVFDLRQFKIDGDFFFEGEFCYLWAKAVASILEQQGFQVVLTREEDKRTNDFRCGKDLGDSIREHLLRPVSELLNKFKIPPVLLEDFSIEQLLPAAMANQLELHERASLINDVNPPFVISLHLNGDTKCGVTEKNGILGFVNPGYEDCHALFCEIVGSASRMTELPLLANELEFYSAKSSVGGGLYLRPDLTLLKNSRVPVLLLEGPFQNNLKEVRKLRESMADYRNGFLSGRLKELAQAVTIPILRAYE